MATKLCGHDINGFTAISLAIGVIGFFMGNCSKTLQKTRFYQLYVQKTSGLVPAEEYTRGIIMVALQSFIYSIPLIALGLVDPFNDHGVVFFWGINMVSATIYGHIAVWHNTKAREVVSWKQFGCTCYIPLVMLPVVSLWLMFFNVSLDNPMVMILTNTASSLLSALTIAYIQNQIGRD